MTEEYQNITGQPCPYEACGSSDAFSYNTRGFGKCFSCKRAYPSKDKTFSWAETTYPKAGSKPKVVVDNEPEVKTNGKYAEWRGLSVKTMDTSDRDWETKGFIL